MLSDHISLADTLIHRYEVPSLLEGPAKQDALPEDQLPGLEHRVK